MPVNWNTECSLVFGRWDMLHSNLVCWEFYSQFYSFQSASSVVYSWWNLAALTVDHTSVWATEFRNIEESQKIKHY